MALLSLSCKAADTKILAPILRQGQWEIVTTDSTSVSERTVEMRCVGPKSMEEKLLRSEFESVEKSCKFSRVVRKLNNIEYTVSCIKYDDVIANTAVAYKGDFSRQFNELRTLSFNVETPIEGLRQNKRYQFRGKCSKDMKQGDTFTRINNAPPMPKWNRYDPPQMAPKNK